MEEILIAPCGMNCAICSSYLAQKYDLKKDGIKKSYCGGCRPRGKNCAFMKKNCELIGEGRIKYCFECVQFPCKRLKNLDERYRSKYHMSMIENLRDIKEFGITKFLAQQEKTWKCPTCEGAISCHDGFCYNCQMEERKKKKKQDHWTGG
jgi:hypothetical protein